MGLSIFIEFVWWTPKNDFSAIIGMFPLDQIADVGVSPSKYLKLCSREIVFEVFHPL